MGAFLAYQLLCLGWSANSHKKRVTEQRELYLVTKGKNINPPPENRLRD